MSNTATTTENAFVFLEKRNPEPDEVGHYYAVLPGRLQTLRRSKTYDQYGQEIGTYNMGDSIEFKTHRAVYLANTTAWEQDESYEFSQDDNNIVNGHDHPDVFDHIETALVNSDLVEGEDYDIIAETCTGFEYWDGSNFRTILVNAENDDSALEWKIVEDEEMVKQLNDAIDTMTHVEEASGFSRYHSGEWEIVQSYWVSDWEDYVVKPLEED